jgi:hypothetical protein
MGASSGPRRPVAHSHAVESGTGDALEETLPRGRQDRRLPADSSEHPDQRRLDLLPSEGPGLLAPADRDIQLRGADEATGF